MDKNLEEILAYEDRLLQDRQQLQRLIAECEGDKRELIQDKLDYFSKELQYMQSQAESLRKSMGAQVTEVPQPLQNPMPSMQQAQSMPPVPPTPPMPPIPPMPPVPPVQPAFHQNIRKDAPKKDFEKAIGKSFMGIVASVLIFISLILFATIVLPYFSEGAKMATTYVISLAFLITGLIKVRKNRENKFFLAITSCGVGALYISLLLSNMYFKAIGDITLYCMIALWGFGVCFLCKIQSQLFQSIGQAGILISLIFGCILCTSNGDETKFFVLLIYYLVTTVMFFMANPEREIEKNHIFHIFNGINSLLVSVVGGAIFEPDNYVGLFFIVFLLVCNIGLLFWCTTKEKASGCFSVCSTLFLWELFFVLTIIFADTYYVTRSLILYGCIAVLMTVFELRNSNHVIEKYIPQTSILVMAAISMSQSVRSEDVFGDYMYVPLLVIPALILGIFRSNKLCMYASEFYLFLYLLRSVDDAMVHMVLAGVAAVLMYVFLYAKREEYSAVFKYVLHTLTILIILVPFGSWLYQYLQNAFPNESVSRMEFSLVYFLIAGLNLFMLKSSLQKNWDTMEPENPAYHNIINMILMITGLIGIGNGRSDFWHILTIVVTLAVFMTNSKNLLDKTDSIFTGFYVGIKFVVLLITILNSFDVVNYMVSILCFTMAIGSIVIGFVCSYKSLRLFGLLLSMISTFKMVMVDITYDNTLGNATSFFVSGILCFIISLLYNYIDDKYQNRRKDSE